MSHNRFGWGGVVILALGSMTAFACGGDFVSDDGAGGSGSGGKSGSGGTSGSGGSGAGSGTGGSANSSGTGGGGGSADCVPGGGCAEEGSSCTPAGCCQCSYRCDDGVWQPSACPSCLAPACPAEPPQNGAACNECQVPIGVVCSWGGCPAEPKVSALCNGAEWSVHEEPCTPPMCCSSDSECGGGVCASTVCKPWPESGCWTNGQCESGLICSGALICPCNADCIFADEPGRCVPVDGCCASDVDCEGLSCVAGVCKEPLEPGSCWSNRDCNGGTCEGAQVCECGMACVIADMPGYCLTDQ